MWHFQNWLYKNRAKCNIWKLYKWSQISNRPVVDHQELDCISSNGNTAGQILCFEKNAYSSPFYYYSSLHSFVIWNGARFSKLSFVFDDFILTNLEILFMRIHIGCIVAFKYTLESPEFLIFNFSLLFTSWYNLKVTFSWRTFSWKSTYLAS